MQNMRRMNQNKFNSNDFRYFEWDSDVIISLLGKARNRQGKLMGKMESLGYELSKEVHLENLTLEVINSAEIEGEILNPQQVRSSLARQLKIKISHHEPSEKHTDSIADVILDTALNFEKPLTKERIFDWYISFFDGKKNGKYEDVHHNLMKSSAGSISFISKEEELNAFIEWFNNEDKCDLFIKAGLAHFWFVKMCPFDNYYGIIARNISNLLLARSDESMLRFYSLTAQINSDFKAYKNNLEMIQREMLDVTIWLQWFINALLKAISASDQIIAKVLYKQDFWNKALVKTLNERQKIMLAKLRIENTMKLSTKDWAIFTQCSSDSALRDINDLIYKKIIKKDRAGGRSTNYLLNC